MSIVVKAPLEPPNNPPKAGDGVAARAMYAGFVGLTIVAITLGFVGFVTASMITVVAGVGAGGLAWWARDTLIRHGKFEAAGRSFDGLVDEDAGAAARADGPVGELVGLLQEWDRMERRRGSPEFDPWALQSLRTEIQQMIDESPALSRLMHR